MREYRFVQKALMILAAVLVLLATFSQAAQEDLPVFASFGEAADAAGDFSLLAENEDYLSVVTVWNKKVIRAITLTDEHARELYLSALDSENPDEGLNAFRAYARSLPVTRTEEITVLPKEQTELDALAGKTFGELEEEGYVLYGSGGGIYSPTVITMTYGFYEYNFEANASFSEYRIHLDRDDLESLTVKRGEVSGFSALAAMPDSNPDGTYEPQAVPEIPSEEEPAAFNIPVDEYTAKAWPFTAETYADLLDHADARIGQVYCIKGTAQEILSEDPLQAVFFTGEDGKSQPVAVEFPDQLPYSPEAENILRIYADFSSVRDGIPFLTARYLFVFEDPADQDGSSIVSGETDILTGEFAAFIVKTGAFGREVNLAVDGEEITGRGVLIQVMDDEEAGSGSVGFTIRYTEEAGFSAEIAIPEDKTQAFTFTNGTYTGNIYNASGSGGLDADTLKVAFGTGAAYSGAIASTSAIHVTREGSEKIRENGGFAFDDWEEASAFAAAYQNLSFADDEDRGSGLVANCVNDNAANLIDVMLLDGAVWNVTGTSLIHSLFVSSESRVIIPEGVTLTVNGTDYTGCTLAAGSY